MYIHRYKQRRVGNRGPDGPALRFAGEHIISNKKGHCTVKTDKNINANV